MVPEAQAASFIIAAGHNYTVGTVFCPFFSGLSGGVKSCCLIIMPIIGLWVI